MKWTSKFKKYILGSSAAFVVFTQAPLKAQDYKADLEKAMAIYKEKSFEAQMEYSFYPSYTSTIPLEKEMMMIKKKGENYYLNQFGLKTICNEKYVLLIDEESHIIAIDNRLKPSGEKMDAKTKAELESAARVVAGTLGLDSLTVSKGSNVTAEYLGIKNGKKEYAFVYKSGEYEKTVFYLDAKDHHISKVKIFYREPVELEEGKWVKTRVEISYLHQAANPVFTDDTFSMSKYIELKKEGVVVPNEKYRSYTVINHLVKTRE